MGCTLTVPVTVVTPGEDEKAEAGPTQTVAKNSSNRVFPLKPLPQQQEQEQETSHGGDEKDNIKKANPAIRQQGTFKSGDLALKDEYIAKMKQDFIRLNQDVKSGLVRVKSLEELIRVEEGDVLRSMRTMLWTAIGDNHLLHGDEWTQAHLAALDYKECCDRISQLEKMYGGSDGKQNQSQLDSIRQLYAHLPNKSPLALASLKGCANMLQIDRFLFPVDKQDVTFNDGRLFEFALDVKVFDTASNCSSIEALQVLKGLMLKKLKLADGAAKPAFVTLHSSPVNTVTLPAPARLAANIPIAAAFYSFCYPYDFDLGEGEDLSELLERHGIHYHNDPFVSWLIFGGYVYYNSTYDIVAVNAFSTDEKEAKSRIFFGVPTEVKPSTLDLVSKLRRFKKLTHFGIRGQGMGFEDFAWITPSEMVGTTIFTRSGGFIFKVVERRDPLEYRYWYFPVVPPISLDWRMEPTEWESPVHIPEYVAYMEEQKRGLTPAGVSDSKFAPDAPDISSMSSGKNDLSVFGLEHLLNEAGIETDTIHSYGKDGMEAIKREFKESSIEAAKGSDGAKWEDQEDWKNFEYVTKKKRREAEEVTGNDGNKIELDVGRDDIALETFHKSQDAQDAKLTLYEVAALRLYTSSSFRRINNPLRELVGAVSRAARTGSSPKKVKLPMPATTYFISSALKKLRVKSMNNDDFEKCELWRGMKNLTTNEDFIKTGGAEAACMSTTTDLRVVANYSKSVAPLLIKIKIETPMEHGAEISWLSLFPGEQEVLYPPLTFLKPVRVQPIKGMEQGQVITVKPSFPS